MIVGQNLNRQIFLLRIRIFITIRRFKKKKFTLSWKFNSPFADKATTVHNFFLLIGNGNCFSHTILDKIFLRPSTDKDEKPHTLVKIYV